jgi:hypothetical protein
MPTKQLPVITVKAANALTFPCDVLVLKYAQASYGVDALVSNELTQIHPQNRMEPSPGEFSLLPANGAITAKKVLFIGVIELRHFDYGQIRNFGYLAMQLLSKSAPDAASVAMTIHGAGYGLDEREAFSAQLAGVKDAIRDHLYPSGMKSLTIVEQNQGRARRLGALLGEVGANLQADFQNERGDFGQVSSTKPHVFVAMPFSGGEMEDVFGFGIQGPVNNAGYLCERVDMSIFTGDIMERVRERIDTAKLVIADLTGANPNVYLEVGYAWGRSKPTLLLLKGGSDLKFDVRGQRCVTYRNITDLSQKLTLNLAALLPA